MAGLEKDIELDPTLSNDHTKLRNQPEIVAKLVVDDFHPKRVSSLESGYRMNSGHDEESQRPSTSAIPSDDAAAGNIKRRGFLSKFVLIPEIEDPMEYPIRTKWTITAVIAIGASLAPLGSSIIFRK